MTWIIIAFFLLLLAGIVILLPFFRPPTLVESDEAVDTKLLALYTRRDQLYQAIREAKFDLDTGKLSPEDYERQVTRLKRQAASVLKAIDRREANLVPPEWDAQIEEQVRMERRGRVASRSVAVAGQAGATSPGQARYCPQCGTRLNPGDRFCPACGARMT
jgi:chorismate mutase